MNPPELPFEQAIARLEDVVSRLESGELSLEESLRCFEEGISLQRRCIGQLEAAQQRIEVLQAASEEVGSAPQRGSNGLSLALEDASSGA